MENQGNNPMAQEFPFDKAPRCTARSKRTLKPCKQPAVKGWRVCRFHGAGGGAPCGPAHGNYRHGMKTKAAIAERRRLARLLAESRELATEILAGE